MGIFKNLFGKAPAAKQQLIDVPNCIKSDSPRVSLTVMTIADSHGRINKDDLKSKWNDRIDAVFMLGDNFPDDIEAALEIIPQGVAIYAVSGNHDSKDLLSHYERLNELNGQRTELKGCSITGLSGSIRYKQDDYYSLITNEESERILSDTPYSDILITHDKPCFNKPETVMAHSGLTGIGEYIKVRRPEIVLHGHLHEPYIKKYQNTVIRCCYGVEVFEIAF